MAGDFAGLGVYRGQTAKFIHYYAPERRLHLFDTFEGFEGAAVARERAETGIDIRPSQFADTCVEGVRARIKPKNANVLFHKGVFPQSIPHQLEGTSSDVPYVG